MKVYAIEHVQLISRCEEAGAPVAWDDPIDGFRRAFVNDPFGNRIEFMEPAEYLAA